MLPAWKRAQKSKGTHTAFSNRFEISVFVSLALVLQAANMYLWCRWKTKKGHRQGRPIDRTIVSYLAGGLSRMSGITTGSCSGCCPRSSDLEADLARPCFSPTVPSWCRWFSCYRNSLRWSSGRSRGDNHPARLRLMPCSCSHAFALLTIVRNNPW